MLRIKELREQNRLNQEGLAIKLGLSQPTISAYEVGERVPDLKTLIALANCFGVSLDYLVGLSDAKQQIKQSDLLPDELDHLYSYRRLSKHSKEKVNAYIDGLQRK